MSVLARINLAPLVTTTTVSNPSSASLQDIKLDDSKLDNMKYVIIGSRELTTDEKNLLARHGSLTQFNSVEYSNLDISSIFSQTQCMFVFINYSRYKTYVRLHFLELKLSDIKLIIIKNRYEDYDESYITEIINKIENAKVFKNLMIVASAVTHSDFHTAIQNYVHISESTGFWKFFLNLAKGCLCS